MPLLQRPILPIDLAWKDCYQSSSVKRKLVHKPGSPVFAAKFNTSLHELALGVVLGDHVDIFYKAASCKGTVYAECRGPDDFPLDTQEGQVVHAVSHRVRSETTVTFSNISTIGYACLKSPCKPRTMRLTVHHPTACAMKLTLQMLKTSSHPTHLTLHRMQHLTWHVISTARVRQCRKLKSHMSCMAWHVIDPNRAPRPF